jgi:hypothetical protein
LCHLVIIKEGAIRHDKATLSGGIPSAQSGYVQLKKDWRTERQRMGGRVKGYRFYRQQVRHYICLSL